MSYETSTENPAGDQTELERSSTDRENGDRGGSQGAGYGGDGPVPSPSQEGKPVLSEATRATDSAHDIHGEERSIRQLFHDVRGHLSVCVSGARIIRRKLARGISAESAKELDDILVQMEMNLRAGLDDLTILHDRNR